MKYLIIGNKGQLGKEFEELFIQSKMDYTGVDIDECNISNLNDVMTLVKATKPDVILNCSAYNNVDLAETEPEQAFNTNAIGVRNIGQAAELAKSFVVHYSTDYVFDGTKKELYLESDEPNPLSVYGKSKLEGEKLLRTNYDNYLIFRVSWLFGQGQQNFIFKFLRWAKTNPELKISVDEVSIPTSTKTVAETTMFALNERITGLYHLTNSGHTSRFGWAEYMVKALNLENNIIQVTKEMFHLPAKRPDFSAMNNKLIRDILHIEIINWEDAVSEFLVKMKYKIWQKKTIQ